MRRPVALALVKFALELPGAVREAARQQRPCEAGYSLAQLHRIGLAAMDQARDALAAELIAANADLIR